MMKTNIQNFSQISADQKTCFSGLENAIAQIFRKKNSQLSYDELYHSIYTLVINRQQEKLYCETKIFIENNIKEKLAEFLMISKEKIIAEILFFWREIKEMLNAIKSIYLYLNKNYILPKKLPSIVSVGKVLFLKYFLNETGDIYEKLMKEFLQMLQTDRENEIVDQVNYHGFLFMVRELGEVSNEFHDLFFKRFSIDAKNFYKGEVQNLLSNCSCSEFLSKCVLRFQSEIQRMDDFFDPESKERIITIFMEVYVDGNCNFLMENEENGLKFFINSEKFEDLRNLFFISSYSKISFEFLQNQIVQIINQNYSKIFLQNKEKRNFIKVVDEIFEFRERIWGIVEKSFKVPQRRFRPFESSIEKTIKETFVNLINVDMKVSNYLNRYLDCFLQKDHQKLSEGEIETKIDQIIEIFKLLKSKDLFELQYKKLLTTRVLVFKNFAEEHEYSFLKRITTICGTSCTSKFYTFLTEIKISGQIFQEFKSQCNSKSDLDKVGIDIISQGICSFEDNFENFEFPNEVSQISRFFEEFYKSKYPDRKVAWVSGLGIGVVRATFCKKPKDLVVNNLQMFSLLCFNNKNKSTKCKEIQKTLRMNKLNAIKQALLPLLKLKILLRNVINEENELKDDEILSVNDNFTHKYYEIKVPFKITDEDGDLEEQKALKVLNLERKIIIEAYVIRILKARKQLSHAELIKEITDFCSQRNFVPSLVQIKDSIESLINREYIKRNNDPGIYSYNA